MCTYNGESYLQEQLLSIAKQTSLPYELVVCDDYSIDATLQILDEFQKAAPFSVRIYRNETNLGATKNFEKAIALCSGDVIVLSDQDDLWMPHKLERLKQLLEEHLEAGYIFSDALVTDEMLHPLGCTIWEQVSFTGRKRRLFEQGHQLEILLKRNVVTGATMAFRAKLRDWVLPIPDTCIHDEWIALIGSAIGRKGIFIAEPLIYYRQHPKQVLGCPKLKAGLNERLQRKPSTKREKDSYKRTKYLQVINRLISLNIVNRDAQKLVNDRICHLEARELLYKASLLKHVDIVLRELIAGRYHKFSKGWRSFMKDLFIPISGKGGKAL